MPKILIFGATGRLGTKTAHYLSDIAHTRHLDINLNLVAPDSHKLARLANTLPLPKAQLLWTRAANKDEEVLRTEITQADIVISCAGPYRKFGDSVLKICIEVGTDYVDASREMLWLYDKFTSYWTDAAESGTRILAGFGLQAAPCAIGCQAIQHMHLERYGSYAKNLRAYRYNFPFELTQGSIATLHAVMEELQERPSRTLQSVDPYLFTKHSGQVAASDTDQKVEFCEDIQAWVSPILVGIIDKQITHAAWSSIDDSGFTFDLKYVGVIGDRAEDRTRAEAIQNFDYMNAKPGDVVTNDTMMPTSGEDLKFEIKTLDPDFPAIIYTWTDKTRSGWDATATYLSEAALLLTEAKDLQAGFHFPSGQFGNAFVKQLLAIDAIGIDSEYEKGSWPITDIANQG